MQIEFIGNDCPLKSFQFGVMGDNKSNSIEFILESLQDEIDLTQLKGYLKSNTSTLSFIDKEPIKFNIHEDRKIKGIWKLLRKHTSNRTLNVQLQFEDTSSDIVWQTNIITFNFTKMIDADKEIENKNPSILQEFDKRITALEIKEDESIQEFNSIYLFPKIGKNKTIYIDNTENMSYRWDSEYLKYYCIGSDYKQIKIINGGTL